MDRKVIFKAQETNRARIQAANRQLKRALNASIKEGEDALVGVEVRLSIVLWMSWAEASVWWLASHPRIPDAEAKKILAKDSHEAKWKALFKYLCASSAGIVSASHAQQLSAWIKDELKRYAEVRNKIAHGQWEVCLNASHTRSNPDMSSRVLALTKGDVLVAKAVAEELAELAELLIVDPAQFVREYDKAVKRMALAKKQFRDDVSWLLREIRRRRRPRRG